ncbi:MAG: cytochrome b/b6 domain-containing protein [Pseudomonadota bacterium]
MKTVAKSHGFVTRTIHWLSAALVVYGYVKGLDNVSQLNDPALLRFEVLFALVLGAVFALRWVWTNCFAGATRLPQDAPRWEQVASRLVHSGLYIAVFAIVLSGLGIALGFSVPVLGGLFLSAMLAFHEASLVALPVLLVLHIAGAVWHKLVRRDGVMESMTGRLPPAFARSAEV